MKIVCGSDLHGNLFDVPKCDLLILAGDLTPGKSWKDQRDWLEEKFKPWLKKIDVPVVGIAGNHDSIWVEEPYKVPILKMEYLQDSEIEIKGLKIYGTPWSLPCGWFPFMATETQLGSIYSKIDKPDIIISHGPPYGCGDEIYKNVFGETKKEKVGSKTLLSKIIEIKPKLVVCGHIHCSRGIYKVEDTLVINASLVDEFRNMVHDPIMVEI